MKPDSTGRLKILVLASTFPRWKGDSEPPFVFELSSRLAKQFDITVLAPRAPKTMKQEAWGEGLTVIRFPYFYSSLERLAYQGGILANLRMNPLLYLLVPFFLIGQLWAIIKICRRENIQVIHAHWIFPQGFLALLARFFVGRRPYTLVTSHGGDLYGLRGSLFAFVKKWVLERSDRVSVVSQAMLQDVLNICSRSINASVISMGVDLTEKFVPSDNVKKNPRQILFVGRLVEKKGCDVLLKALPAVIGVFPDVEVKVVGDGPDRSSLESLADSLGVRPRVSFVGRLPNDAIVAFYQSSAVFAMPAIIAGNGDQEGLGLVSVEAMGCGCPVVASDLPAIQDVVKHGVTGLLFPSGDEAALADTLINSLMHPREAADIARQARAYVVEHYDWATVTARYAQLLLPQ